MCKIIYKGKDLKRGLVVARGGTEGYSRYSLNTYFFAKKFLYFLTLENTFSNKKTSLQEMPGLMKRPFCDVGNDGHTGKPGPRTL